MKNFLLYFCNKTSFGTYFKINGFSSQSMLVIYYFRFEPFLGFWNLNPNSHSSYRSTSSVTYWYLAFVIIIHFLKGCGLNFLVSFHFNLVLCHSNHLIIESAKKKMEISSLYCLFKLRVLKVTFGFLHQNKGLKCRRFLRKLERYLSCLLLRKWYRYGIGYVAQ